MYLIEKILLNDVLTNEDRYNSNNHGDMPNDYLEVIDKTKFSNYIDNFYSKYQKITLDSTDIQWILEAYNIGKQTNKFPSSYIEDLEDLLIKYKKETDQIFTGKNYFVRTDRTSMKYGCHGVGPYKNLKEIIESIVTTISNHSCIRKGDITCPIYILPWLDNLDTDKEFRVFVYQNKITAISQQKYRESNKWLNNKSVKEIQEIIKIIIDHFNLEIKPKIKTTDNYVFDMVMLDQPYFIEANSFGKEYASGSALFHWLEDESILYSKNNNVTFRYI